MQHKMKLNEVPFELIQSWKKKIEIRLWDEKRQSLHLWDTIMFSKVPKLEENICCEVIGLLRYATFHDLLADFSLSYLGRSDEEDRNLFLRDLYTIYSKEEEEKYGVVGIRIRKIW